ncbi:MAG TPA: ATP-binding protein [Ideonella sp.]|uniref:sensor histidine kinase n=1 Tax=Ideonella sp. TaxID=1929293 RepID=UPI002E37E708|nr:ATP-binding protein [Ideonella sp.]HEX5685364.1 ATP-binding protein [Ideonella sp.]
MSFWRSRSIQARIQQLVLVCVIPGWLLLLAQSLLTYQRERGTEQVRACHTARTLANALEAELDSHVVALQALATSPLLTSPTQPADLLAFREQAERALPHLGGETLVLTDPTGRQLFNLLRPAGMPLPLLGPGVFPANADATRPMVSDMFAGSVSQHSQVAVHVPVLRDGQLSYRLTLMLGLQRLADFLRRQNLPEGWISSVLDRRGITMARTVSPERFVGLPVVPALLDHVLHDESSCFLTTSREGVQVFAGHARAPRYGWSTTIGVPEAALTADLRKRLVTSSSVAMLMLLAGLLLARLLSRLVAEPIRALVAPALAIGSGQQVEIPEPSMDEARQLTDALRQAQDLLRQRQRARSHAETALQQSESMLRHALQAGRMGVWELDLSSNELRHSPDHDRCFGYPQGAPRFTLEDFRRAVHPDDIEWVAESQGKALREGRPLHIDFRVVWPDGSVHWMSSHSQVMTGDDGRPTRIVGLVVDITERKHAEELRLRSVALEAENRQVQEANRQKREFLANMSHELRTPLNAIVGFADLLRLSPPPPGSTKQAEYLAHIAGGAQHLLQLVNDVLDLSKVEAGRFEFFPAAVDLPALVDETLAMLRAEAERKHISLHTELEPLPDLWLDPARLKQVLLNFVSNAVKFTPEGGRIVVRAMARGSNGWHLEVEDNGIGIAAEDQPKLFSQFAQLRQRIRPIYGGTGLGLALTRQLVELQGGQVGVRSQAGAGSTFFADLPRKAVTGALQ